MFGDDAVANRQTESCAFADFFGRKKRFEDFRHIFGRDAAAGVFYFDNDAVILFKGAKCQRSAFGHRVNRIGRQRDNGLLNLSLVGIDRRQSFREFEFSKTQL